MLWNKPKIEELDLKVGNDRWVEESDIKDLVCLQAITKESLRLYPPVPFSVPYEAMKDCHVCGYHTPKVTRLIVNVWKLHRDPIIWKDREDFLPERFLSNHICIYGCFWSTFWVHSIRVRKKILPRLHICSASIKSDISSFASRIRVNTTISIVHAREHDDWRIRHYHAQGSSPRSSPHSTSFFPANSINNARQRYKPFVFILVLTL